MASAVQVQQESRPGVIRFAVFEFDAAARELRKKGIRLRLQTKPCQVLRALLETPGAIVTREELHRRLWPEDTFVDFERGLNTAVNRLRIALSDSADTPRYIETVARTGYRFIAPVISGDTEPTAVPSVSSPSNRRRMAWMIAATALIAASITLATITLLRPAAQPQLRFRQITFRRGQVSAARFALDDDIVYTAQWEDGRRRVFITNAASPESRSLGFDGRSIVSVSRTGELALLKSGGTMNITGGELSRAPMNGGSPLHVDDNIMAADWAPDGKSMVVVRATGGANQLESPPGRVLYRTAGWISDPRTSPRGDAIVFIDHPVRHDDAGDVRIVDSSGRSRILAAGWTSARGLAWLSSGREISFTAARDGGSRSLWTVDVSGKLRSTARYPGMLTLRDISKNGRLLLTSETRRLEMAGMLRGDAAERSISWLDWSRVQSLSHDGNVVLFDEGGEAVGSRPVAYLYRRDLDSTLRLGDGAAEGLSPDEQWVLMLDFADRHKLRLAPTAGGRARNIQPSGLMYQWARFFHDGRRAVTLASDPEGALGLYVISLLDRTAPVKIAGPIMVRNLALSPSDDRIAVLTPDGKLIVISTDGQGQTRELPSPEPLAPLRWSNDGEWIFVQHLRAPSELPAPVSRLRVSTGELQPWKRIIPADRMGVNAITGIVIADDEQHYMYSYRRVLSELFVAER